MFPILTEGMRWIPSPRPGSTESGNITGVYLGPDENVEWFCIRNPKDGNKVVVGYAIRKKEKSATRKRPRLYLAK
jgi:hypothetical protein